MHNTRNYVYDPEETYIVLFFVLRLDEHKDIEVEQIPAEMARRHHPSERNTLVGTLRWKQETLVFVPGNRVQYSWKALSACTASRYFARKKPPELFRPILRYRLLPDERVEDR